MSNIESILNEIKEQSLSNEELVSLAHALLTLTMRDLNAKSDSLKLERDARYLFAKERIVKSNARKNKSLRKTIISYFRGKEGGISNNEVDLIVKRLVGEKIIFIDSEDNVEYLA